MSSKIGALAGAVLALGASLAQPAVANSHSPQYGEHTGSVVLREAARDAAKSVGERRAPAPFANVDIRRAQFTQTDGLLTLDLDLSDLRLLTVDRLVVRLDSDGDAKPDQLVQWNGHDANAPVLEILDGAWAGRPTTSPVDCPDAAIDPDYGIERVHVVIDRSCLPVVGATDQGDGPVLHANLAHLQVMVVDRVAPERRVPGGVRARWDLLGGGHTMLAIPF